MAAQPNKLDDARARFWRAWWALRLARERFELEIEPLKAEYDAANEALGNNKGSAVRNAPRP